MYSRLLFNFCGRSLYRRSSSIKLNIVRSSHAVNKTEEKQVKIISEKFPDYEAIYIFPYSKIASSINRVKYRFTIFSVITMPIIGGLYPIDILSFENSMGIIMSECVLMIWLHTIGLAFNNLIGYIYCKMDEEKTILSYIDYWGKRVDMKVSFNEIIPTTDTPTRFTDSVHRKVMFYSRKKSLKINIRFGRILNAQIFTYILGTV